jgi:hypothetical protein
MPRRFWRFEAGARVPRWLVETVDCTAVFNWPAIVIECGAKWQIFPTEPVRNGTPPFLLRPATERHRGAAIPTREFALSYAVHSDKLDTAA